VDQGREALRTLSKRRFSDAEASVYLADVMIAYEDPAGALQVLAHAVETGFACPTWLERDRLFDVYRHDGTFQQLFETTVRQHEAAVRAFRAARGEEVLASS
jgi:hypothetical protein